MANISELSEALDEELSLTLVHEVRLLSLHRASSHLHTLQGLHGDLQVKLIMFLLEKVSSDEDKVALMVGYLGGLLGSLRDLRLEVFDVAEHLLYVLLVVFLVFANVFLLDLGVLI